MIALATAVLVAVAATTELPPVPEHWVNDRVEILSPGARDALDRRLAAYQRTTGHQVVVWIGDTLDGAPLDDWAARTFAAWKIGRAGFDDGVVIFVFIRDRAIDIEVGYGLEHRVPDAVAARVIHEVMVPRMQRGEHDAALTAGVDALLAALEGHPWVDGTEVTPAPNGPSVLTVVLAALAAIGFLVLLITHPRFALLLLWSIVSGGGRTGRGGKGNGFLGGGGRSGGGGARGKW